MKKNVLKVFLVLFILLIGVFNFFNLVNASSDASAPSRGVLKGVKCAATGSLWKNCDLCDFFQVAINVSELILAFSGVIGFLLFVYAGLLFLLAPYKPDYVGKAKGMMVAVVIGLFIVFGSYTIVNFIIKTAIQVVPQYSEGWDACKLN